MDFQFDGIPVGGQPFSKWTQHHRFFSYDQPNFDSESPASQSNNIGMVVVVVQPHLPDSGLPHGEVDVVDSDVEVVLVREVDDVVEVSVSPHPCPLKRQHHCRLAKDQPCCQLSKPASQSKGSTSEQPRAKYLQHHSFFASLHPSFQLS